jgi:hypothetical protein
VIRKPLKVLVCLSIMFVVAGASVGWGYKGAGAPGAPAIQGDALSADPSVTPLPPLRTGTTPQGARQSFPSTRSAVSSTSSKSSAAKPYARSAAVVVPQVTAPVVAPPVSWQAGMGQAGMGQPGMMPGACPPQQPCNEGILGTLFGAFGTDGISFGNVGCAPFLPRPGCKQFHVLGRVWYPSLNSSTVQWGAIPGGWSGTELSLTEDLHLRRHEYVWEVEAQCQLRQNWGLRYSYMPIKYRDNYTSTRTFWFGNQVWPIFQALLTEWDRKIHRFDLVYNWFQGAHAVSSVFGGFHLVDDKLTVQWPSQAFAGFTRTRSSMYHVASAGMSVDRVISKVGDQGIASVHCRWSIQFLEGFVGWDGLATGRLAVPYGGGRYGYLEAGYRWIVLDRQMPSNTDKTSLDGPIASMGVVF